MKKDFLKLFCPVWAFVGTPGLFAGFIYWSYWYANLKEAYLPFINFLPEWLWFFCFGFCLFSGLVALLAMLNFKIWIRIICAVTYLLVMAFLMLFANLLIAGPWGDCL